MLFRSRLLGKPVLFISFDQAMHDADELSDDAQLIQAVCSHLPEDIRTRTFTEEVHPSSILRLIESATAVISMRLHGCILAASAAKPLLALECDAKVGAVLSDIGLEDHVVKLSAMNPTVCDAVLVRAMTTAGLAVSSSAADYAKVLSSQAPPLLAKAVAEATVPAVPSALSNLVPRLVSRSLRTHSLVTQNLPLFATVARDAVNGGNVKLARAMLAILRMYDAECGEWYYLEAVANASEGGPSDYTFTMLEKARVLGFDETWIRYVRACTLVRIGRLEAAIAERDAARAAAGSHPAIPSFDAAF